ncbi:hypothetical protein [Micromonospora sp. NPDC049891]|uniref:hypothetical protein n=1 Tax=Micromonospora sp. NPDC049891 TaxID=3155655 RepID=UPI0033F41ADA
MQHGGHWYLLDLLATARTQSGRGHIHRLLRFYTRCATTDLPELHRLATTIETWWPHIHAFLARRRVVLVVPGLGGRRCVAHPAPRLCRLGLAYGQDLGATTLVRALGTWFGQSA